MERAGVGCQEDRKRYEITGQCYVMAPFFLLSCFIRTGFDIQFTGYYDGCSRDLMRWGFAGN